MNFLATNYYVYGMFLCVLILHTAACHPRCLLLNLYCSIICSSLSELDDACHTNEFITKLDDRCVDLTTPLSHNMI